MVSNHKEENKATLFDEEEGSVQTRKISQKKKQCHAPDVTFEEEESTSLNPPARSAAPAYSAAASANASYEDEITRRKQRLSTPDFVSTTGTGPTLSPTESEGLSGEKQLSREDYESYLRMASVQGQDAVSVPGAHTVSPTRIHGEEVAASVPGAHAVRGVSGGSAPEETPSDDFSTRSNEVLPEAEQQQDNSGLVQTRAVSDQDNNHQPCVPLASPEEKTQEATRMKECTKNGFCWS